jgi:hypothetical protein
VILVDDISLRSVRVLRSLRAGRGDRRRRCDCRRGSPVRRLLPEPDRNAEESGGETRESQEPGEKMDSITHENLQILRKDLI